MGENLVVIWNLSEPFGLLAPTSYIDEKRKGDKENGEII